MGNFLPLLYLGHETRYHLDISLQNFEFLGVVNYLNDFVGVF